MTPNFLFSWQPRSLNCPASGSLSHWGTEYPAWKLINEALKEALEFAPSSEIIKLAIQ